jgi:K+-transporting ATPase A subunit
MVNCNEQHYSGESNLTYFCYGRVIMLFQFITAATGMAAMAGIMKALGEKTTKTIGNFWNYLVLSCTRILLPLSLVVGFLAAFVSGCLACKWMINIVKKGKLIYFAIYCAIAGVITLILS